jgi:hypothetical protein
MKTNERAVRLSAMLVLTTALKESSPSNAKYP